MDGLFIALQVGQFVAIGGLSLFAWRYLPKYVEKKAENLATKEDVAEITSLTEQARLPYVETLERLRGNVQRETSRLTKRQELYIQFAEAAAATLLSGRKVTDEDNRRFLAAHAALFLHAPDEIVNAFNAHIDLQIKVAALPVTEKSSLQSELQRTFAELMVALRREGFHSDTLVHSAAFRFISFE